MSNRSNRPIQDFEPIVFSQKTKPIINYNNNKNKNSDNHNAKQNIIMAKIDNEEIKIPTMSNDMCKNIQQARCNKKMSQEDLAKKCNLPKDVIRDYENGKAVPKKSDLIKISRNLGINLQMPKLIETDE